MANIALVLPWCVGKVAPLYNLGLVLVVVFLFIKLMKIPTKIYKRPWKILFIAVGVFVGETLITITGILTEETHFILGFFELAIIILFIYMILLQKEYIKSTG